MKKSISSKILINSKSEKVMAILMDFTTYGQWNTFITEASGNIKKGNQLKVHIQNMTFKPVVTEVKKNSFEWLGTLFFKGLFDGKHSFEVRAINEEQCEFEHKETFSGILVGLFKKKIDQDIQQGFDEMCHQLKKFSESASY